MARAGANDSAAEQLAAPVALCTRGETIRRCIPDHVRFTPARRVRARSTRLDAASRDALLSIALDAGLNLTNEQRRYSATLSQRVLDPNYDWARGV